MDLFVFRDKSYQKTEIASFRTLIEAELTKSKEKTFHDILEKRSIWLSNRVAEIIQHLSLALELDTLFHEVNQRNNKGGNPPISINKKGKPHIETPKVEKPNTQLISNYLGVWLCQPKV